MKYTTTNEFEHFEYQEAHISDIQFTDGVFFFLLDNVKILPENSCNRDIRTMRANELFFRVTDGAICSLVEEGYKIYDANGNLKQAIEDRVIDQSDYKEITDTFIDGTIYSMEQISLEGEGKVSYRFIVDAANERTYELTVEGSGDKQEWDRFLNLESAL